VATYPPSSFFLQNHGIAHDGLFAAIIQFDGEFGHLCGLQITQQ
jgi:hypothetical protein